MTKLNIIESLQSFLDENNFDSEVTVEDTHPSKHLKIFISSTGMKTIMTCIPKEELKNDRGMEYFLTVFKKQLLRMNLPKRKNTIAEEQVIEILLGVNNQLKEKLPMVSFTSTKGKNGEFNFFMEEKGKEKREIKIDLSHPMEDIIECVTSLITAEYIKPIPDEEIEKMYEGIKEDLVNTFSSKITLKQIQEVLGQVTTELEPATFDFVVEKVKSCNFCGYKLVMNKCGEKVREAQIKPILLKVKSSNELFYNLYVLAKSLLADYQEEEEIDEDYWIDDDEEDDDCYVDPYNEYEDDETINTKEFDFNQSFLDDLEDNIFDVINQNSYMTYKDVLQVLDNVKNKLMEKALDQHI